MVVAILEVTTRLDLIDPMGEAIKRRVKNDLEICLDSVRTKRIYMIDANLNDDELELAREKIFTDAQVEISSFQGVDLPYDYLVHVSWKPGVTDTTGRVAKEALEDLFKRSFQEEAVYTAIQICLTTNSKLSLDQLEQIAGLFSNEHVQDVFIYRKGEDVSITIPKVTMKHEPRIEYIDLNVSDEDLMQISESRKLALNLAEMKAIQSYFNREDVKSYRKKIGMKEHPTDVELEILAQTWSEHCKHKIFHSVMTDIKGNVFEGIANPSRTWSEIESCGGTVHRDENGIVRKIIINSIFDTYIKTPGVELQRQLPWVRLILKDNAGIVDFDDEWLYTLKWESHNSPSAIEPYGGAYTGIVGVYRDPMGTGRGGKIIAGFWSFHVGKFSHDDDLKPRLHPRQLLEGVRKGVEDGGNRSGNPTVWGFVYFHEGFIGKPYIGVGASSLIPRYINGEPGWKKIIRPGDLAVVVGGRVGIDGIHGATESSLEGGAHISSSHVQIGDAYLQKKVQDFIIEARDRGLFKGIQDFGAGGISSAFGELAEITNGAELDISRHPVKYQGLQPWQIMVSESQERMGLSVPPECLEDLMELARKHDVELTVLGRFTDHGKFQVTYGDLLCASLDVDFLHHGDPRYELEAEWLTPEQRGLSEPQLPETPDVERMLKTLLASDNIASYNYIVRQFDHEVQGGSVIKPLVGVHEDVHGDAVVIRPLLTSYRGIAFSTGDNPDFGTIDTYHMVLNNMDEAIRRVIAVGGSLEQIPLNDNFGWPSPLPSENNPECRYRAAQLIRAAKALADGMREFGTPCISGKDSMFMDAMVPTKNGDERRISAPPMVQISAAGLIEDVRFCVTMDPKKPGELVYILGITKNELGGSDYYKILGFVGRNVPQVNIKENKNVYQRHANAVRNLLIESSHGIYRGGLGVHLALMAMAGDLGMEIDLRKVPRENINRDDQVLFSQSAGRLLVTVDRRNKEQFEKMMNGVPFAQIGITIEEKRLKITGLSGAVIIDASVEELRQLYHSTLDGELNELSKNVSARRIWN